jgi:hypothetical protein
MFPRKVLKVLLKCLYVAVRYLFVLVGVSGLSVYIVFHAMPGEERAHFLNLLRSAYRVSLAALSATHLSFITGTIASPIATAVIVFLLLNWLSPKGDVVEHLKESLIAGAVGLAVPLAIMLGTCSWKLVSAVYEDHQLFVAKANAPKPACPACPTAPHDASLTVLYGTMPLEGQTILVNTRHETVDGKVIAESAEHFFFPEQFRVKNLGSHVTGEISVQIYLSQKGAGGGGWVPAISDEPGFLSEFDMPAFWLNGHLRIDPGQTIYIGQFSGSFDSHWLPTDVVSAKLKVFYGAEKPAIVRFKIRKKELVQ